ncbi:glycosyltransferase family 2 protein [Sorangium atrum]|uniref:Glycosyltransferase family 2 protein n=1 Tax=Sorangium atrum TaxID=2995308 RepID=A0ABT5C7F3_9BACT|nr:glycosyltransferase family 2 protein [Sorangium aterium]MDC0682325.1 glycosyltransferase family 2 protein [Sorangium aterium]
MVIASFLAVAVLVYTYFGYPIVIGILARLWPAQRKEDPHYVPTVTACIPVFNASSYLPAKVESLLALDYPKDKLEVLLFSDGSTDDTVLVARQLAERDPRVKVIVSEARRGKPIGVNKMLEVATGEVLLMTDIRQPLVPGALRALVRLLADPNAGCVSGNLVLKGSAGSGAYWRYENWIRLQEGRFRSMVGVTGPIYAIRRADMSQLPEGVILDDMWVPMRLRLEGRSILFAPDAIAYDDAFGDEREFGRKVRTLAGNYQLFSLLPALLVPFRNPSWFEIFSHKLLRLVCPWALAALLITSTVAWTGAEMSGDASWTLYAARALFGGQVAFYLLAALGGAAGKLGALARTFVVLNAAAVVGLWRYLRGSQKVTW